jgi:hypothetical protein
LYSLKHKMPNVAEGRTMARRWVAYCALSAILTGGWLAVGYADDKPKDAKAGTKDMGAAILNGLKATPGCLGVETAQTGSGKQVIFAWFENKKAAMQWHYSDTHRNLMRTFFPSEKYDKPMREVPDDGKPIMAIASITFSDKPKFKETTLPISQISIELYQPLTGGIFLGGRFAPEAMKEPKMKDYTPKGK